MKLSKHISQKGFTLVELLIVIGILGILAAGLLAAIDPLEQLKKGRDNTRRSVAVELTNAVARYYSVFATMPWGTTAVAPGNITTIKTSTVDELTTKGELKPTFWGALGTPLTTGPYTLSVAGGDQTNPGITVCFNPESKSLSRDPNTMFTAVAWPPAPGSNPGDSDTTYIWCTR